jgi:hypothetical protein
MQYACFGGSNMGQQATGWDDMKWPGKFGFPAQVFNKGGPTSIIIDPFVFFFFTIHSYYLHVM